MQTGSNGIASAVWNSNGDICWTVNLEKIEKKRIMRTLSCSAVLTRGVFKSCKRKLWKKTCPIPSFHSHIHQKRLCQKRVVLEIWLVLLPAICSIWRSGISIPAEEFVIQLQSRLHSLVRIDSVPEISFGLYVKRFHELCKGCHSAYVLMISHLMVLMGKMSMRTDICWLWWSAVSRMWEAREFTKHRWSDCAVADEVRSWCESTWQKEV